MSTEQTNNPKLRNERKFVVSSLTSHEIEALIKLHPAIFVEIYQPRFINNLYLDSPSLNSYFSHINGLKDRIKVRIRWYGDLFEPVNEPVLELKTKSGNLGHKESYPLVPFQLDKHLHFERIKELIAQSDVPDALRLKLYSLELSLINRYQRKYYQSADRNYRLTVDSGMTFYQIRFTNNSFLRKSINFTDTIIELKSGIHEDHEVEHITNYFPFQMTKISKYIDGIERVYMW